MKESLVSVGLSSDGSVVQLRLTEVQAWISLPCLVRISGKVEFETLVYLKGRAEPIRLPGNQAETLAEAWRASQ
jgi:hypothetical protein